MAGLFGDMSQYFDRGFNTPVPNGMQSEYAQWLASQKAQQGRDVTKDVVDYDLQGAWLGGLGGAGHMPDTFKKPNHPTFSDQSKYHGFVDPQFGRFEGGTWAQNGKTYTPTAAMLRSTHPLDWLRNYMTENEPGVRLNMGRK